MWPIVYRVLYPGIFGGILWGLMAFFGFRSYKKKKKKDKSKGKRNASIACLIISLFSFSVSAYDVWDVILQDFETQEGTFVKYYREWELYTRHIFFTVDNDEESCHAFSWDVNHLEAGKQYRFTYGKRTGMLISVEEVTS